MPIDASTFNRCVLLEPEEADINLFRERFLILDSHDIRSDVLHHADDKSYAIWCKDSFHIQNLMKLCAPNDRELSLSKAQSSKNKAKARPALIWVSFRKAATESLLRVFSEFPKCGRCLRDSIFFAFEPCRLESLPALLACFRRTAGTIQPYQSLPPEELVEVLALSKEKSCDLFVGGVMDQVARIATLTRGDGSMLVVPFTAFQPSGEGVSPDFERFSVTDYGHTIRLGDYEAASDAILYEFDRQFRARLNAKRREEERTFGAALRRLRKEKRLKRSDFGDISPKTIARIERGETTPRKATLQRIADRLGVHPSDIKDY
jgi:DNA-binding XRE family transcriptional regulator